MDKTRIALITFSDPRYTKNPEERESYIKSSHDNLKSLLEGENIEIIDPHIKLYKKNVSNFGFDNPDDIKKAAKYINEKSADMLIIECFHWSEPQFANYINGSFKYPRRACNPSCSFNNRRFI